MNMHDEHSKIDPRNLSDNHKNCLKAFKQWKLNEKRGVKKYYKIEQAQAEVGLDEESIQRILKDFSRDNLLGAIVLVDDFITGFQLTDKILQWEPGTLELRTDHLSPQKTKVFIAHGRNLKAREAMIEFLKSLSLEPITFDRTVGNTDSAAPYNFDVVKEAMSASHAVVVLLTADEKASLLPCYHLPDDKTTDSRLGQPRPNVMFEAGMALSLFERRTVLVQIGPPVRLISNIAGRHVHQMDDSEKSRTSMINLLRSAGCDVRPISDLWKSNGKFRAAANGSKAAAKGRSKIRQR